MFYMFGKAFFDIYVITLVFPKGRKQIFSKVTPVSASGFIFACISGRATAQISKF